MNTLIFAASLSAAIVVVIRSIFVAAHLSRKNWRGHLLQFVGLSASYALVSGGAIGTALHWPAGATLLLLGMSGWILFDRRGLSMR